MKRLNLLLFVLFLAAPALAQNAPPDNPNDPQAPVHVPRYHGTINDFTKMHFICTSDASGDYLSSNACATAESQARRGANDADFDIESGGRESDKGFTLSVEITSSGKLPRAVAVYVQASRRYKGAVDMESSSTDPAREPHSGKLVFWEKKILAVSNSYGDDLDDAVRIAINGVIKQFFIWQGQQEG